MSLVELKNWGSPSRAQPQPLLLVLLQNLPSRRYRGIGGRQQLLLSMLPEVDMEAAEDVSSEDGNCTTESISTEEQEMGEGSPTSRDGQEGQYTPASPKDALDAPLEREGEIDDGGNQEDASAPAGDAIREIEGAPEGDARQDRKGATACYSQQEDNSAPTGGDPSGVDAEAAASEVTPCGGGEIRKGPIVAETVAGDDASPRTIVTAQTAVSFRDNVDLQTRLVLMPLCDDDCVGARVASYEPPSPCREGVLEVEGDGFDVAMLSPSSLLSSPSSFEDVLLIEEKKDTDSNEGTELDAYEGNGDAEPAVVQVSHESRGKTEQLVYQEDAADKEIVRAKEDEFCTVKSIDGSGSREDSDLSVDITGHILKGMASNDCEDWTKKDFTSILMAIREAPAPIVLFFTPPLEVPAVTLDINLDNRADVATRNGGVEVKKESPNPSTKDTPLPPSVSDLTSIIPTSTANAMKGRFSRWGSQLRTSTSHLAAEASARATLLAERAQEIKADRAATAAIDAALSEAKDDNSMSSRGSEAGSVAKDALSQKEKRVVSPGRNNPNSNDAVKDKKLGQTQSPDLDVFLDLSSQAEGSNDIFGDVLVPQDLNKEADNDAGKHSKTISPLNNIPEIPFSPSNLHGRPPRAPSDIPFKAKERLLVDHGQDRVEIDTAYIDSENDVRPCGIYLQTSSGFISLDVDHGLTAHVDSIQRSTPNSSACSAGSGGSRGSGRSVGEIGFSPARLIRPSDIQYLASKHPVTNTSVIVVRHSPEYPCPIRGYNFQWFRLYRDGRNSYHDDADSLADCTRSNASSVNSDITGWYPLPGATYAAFQPSATDIGYKVQCVVTVNCAEECSHTVVCEIPDVILTMMMRIA